jgi:hypothetical protein
MSEFQGEIPERSPKRTAEERPRSSPVSRRDTKFVWVARFRGLKSTARFLCRYAVGSAMGLVKDGDLS